MQSRDLGGRHVYNLSSALIKGARAKSIYFIVGVLLALSTFVFGYYPSDDLGVLLIAIAFICYAPFPCYKNLKLLSEISNFSIELNDSGLRVSENVELNTYIKNFLCFSVNQRVIDLSGLSHVSYFSNRSSNGDYSEPVVLKFSDGADDISINVPFENHGDLLGRLIAIAKSNLQSKK